MSLKIEEVNRFNWEDCSKLEVKEQQKKFIPDNLYTIAQSKYENLTLYAFYLDNLMIGFGAIGYFSKIYWISRIMIDAKYQNFGYGRIFLQLLLQKIADDKSVREVRAAVHAQNPLAEHFFSKEGFERLGVMDDGEIILHKLFL